MCSFHRPPIPALDVFLSGLSVPFAVPPYPKRPIKVDTISTQFRTFPMEVVAGEPNTEVKSGGKERGLVAFGR